MREITFLILGRFILTNNNSKFNTLFKIDRISEKTTMWRCNERPTYPGRAHTDQGKCF